jgi:hypothetical protein
MCLANAPKIIWLFGIKLFSSQLLKRYCFKNEGWTNKSKTNQEQEVIFLQKKNYLCIFLFYPEQSSNLFWRILIYIQNEFTI